MKKEIRRRIAGFSEDYVFTASDFEIDTQNQSAVVKALNRMVKSGEISKLAKGRFYKPRRTQFGELKPSAYQIAKDYIERDGKLIGYITLIRQDYCVLFVATQRSGGRYVYRMK